MPRTTAAATATGVVENGAGSIPSVIRPTTKPGRTMVTPTPVPTSESPRPWEKASRPDLVEPYTKLALRARSPATDEMTTIRP